MDHSARIEPGTLSFAVSAPELRSRLEETLKCPQMTRFLSVNGKIRGCSGKRTSSFMASILGGIFDVFQINLECNILKIALLCSLKTVAVRVVQEIFRINGLFSIVD